MTLRRPWVPGLLLVLLAACDASPTEVPGAPLPRADRLPLDIPSERETVFAETRDFTVVGYFDPPLTRPGDVLVELFAGPAPEGAPVRVLRSRVDPATGVTPRASLDFAYPHGLAWGPDGPVTEPGEMVMTPDLVAVPGGIEDPTNKVVVTPEYYAAVVLGGVSRDFDTGYADGGVPWRDLDAGVYTIRVTGLSGQLEGLSATRTVEFGTTHALLGRFSPDRHRQALLAWAALNGFRTYIDFFPGFFAHDGYAYEIPGRWMANNSVEVVNTSPGSRVDGAAGARNGVLLYNVAETSATNRVEIGALVANGLLDGRTTFHYYDIGEPVITWVDAASGRPRTLHGRVTTFDPGDRLVVTRVESRPADAVAGDNLWDADDDAPLALDVDVRDGVHVLGGHEMSVYGVVAPIPAGVRPGELAHQYVSENDVRSIGFTVRDGAGRTVSTSVGDVALGRRYDAGAAPGAVATSVYEFEHEVRVEAGSGRYTVVLRGLDREGRPVAHTADSFAVTVGTLVALASPEGSDR